MTAAFGAAKGNIIQKYQKLASQDVIKAVQSASRKTGADFAFLMQKASAESSFNPTAKAKTSSATGLYQFIESTWLNMVKKHGDKFGLGDYANKIEMKNGKAVCQSDCDRKDILALRNDPEIAALMAGAFTAENKAHLQKNTKGDIGATELYFAHFMGAGGASKFLNSRAVNGDAIAADIFPAAAKANKNVFYDKASGEARTLNEVYAFFDKKFGGSGAAAKPETQVAEAAAKPAAPKAAATPARGSIPAAILAQLPMFDDENEKDDIIWNDDPRFYPQSGFTARSNPFGFQKVSPVSILMLAEIQQSLIPDNRKPRYNT
ncbi:MAG: transglycosylase SLT domain-containing protein [Alphaproteobacteria bacterium]